MKLVKVDSGKQRCAYLNFKSRLYAGDGGYVCTAKFNAAALLYKKTDFARSCFIEPVIVLGDDGGICAAGTYIHNPELPYLQLGLFEAEESAEEAVKLIIEGAKETARKRGLEKILAGMNGHLSYGVGILEEGFDNKISFDSVYNKSYYKDYFKPYISGKETLSVYRADMDAVLKRIKPFRARGGLAVREADLKNFARETEILRGLCNRTLDKTFLYTHAGEGHFTQLMGGLKAILRPGNLLFAVKDGVPAGFLFWHPDFNSGLRGGHEYNLLRIYFKAKQAHKKSDAFKINAIGSVGDNPYVTAALIAAAVERCTENFKYAETTFVWDNNARSAVLNRNLFGEPYRRYKVYFIDV